MTWKFNFVNLFNTEHFYLNLKSERERPAFSFVTQGVGFCREINSKNSGREEQSYGHLDQPVNRFFRLGFRQKSTNLGWYMIYQDKHMLHAS